MASYQPAVGDRVRFKQDLGGYLKKDKIGIVWLIDPPSEDSSRNLTPLLVLIPWVREDVPIYGEPWDGKDGSRSVFLGQFQKSPAIPMHPDELEYIDNVLAGGS